MGNSIAAENGIRKLEAAPTSGKQGADNGRSVKNDLAASVGRELSGCCLMSECTDDCRCCNSFWTPEDEANIPTRRSSNTGDGVLLGTTTGDVLGVIEGSPGVEALKCCVLYCTSGCKCCTVEEVKAEAAANAVENDDSIESIVVIDFDHNKSKPIKRVTPEDLGISCCQFSCKKSCRCCTASSFTSLVGDDSNESNLLYIAQDMDTCHN